MAPAPPPEDADQPVPAPTPADQTRGAGPRPEPTIHLDQFLKAQGLVGTGGQAKLVIQGGEVLLNGQVETRRRKQLHAGDRVEFAGEAFIVAFE
ncbi:MAG: RNA-binding S4 domain-containing protein [Planctomycetota bacterium]